jgi:hypothetical protein
MAENLTMAILGKADAPNPETLRGIPGLRFPSRSTAVPAPSPKIMTNLVDLGHWETGSRTPRSAERVPTCLSRIVVEDPGRLPCESV